eukprot:CAMPEP_0198429506 /NCGR_PEP_ID=MMETSP1452-20131203/7799_1 /TAXON_ID=1181717 /ORGANISM="Synchroma pusillum, Strain CCMP3072" /LENGTH=324 /DNA_ID=CAMNT_0044149913 /DNA_START=36 /DNA_END=1010 /DNA_ORIENTATION=-
MARAAVTLASLLVCGFAAAFRPGAPASRVVWRTPTRVMGGAEEDYEEIGVTRINRAMLELTPEEEDYRSEFDRRFGELRGVPLKKVSETMERFHALYTRPMIPLYRELVNKLLTNTHICIVNPAFVYDPVFALGMMAFYDDFLANYPGEERDTIFSALCAALDLDADKIKTDAQRTREYFAGKTEEQVLALGIDSASDEFAEIFARIRSDRFFRYTEHHGIGLVKIMGILDLEVTPERIEAWSKNLVHVRKGRLSLDYDFFKTGLDRMAQGEEIMKQIEIREKKRMAERLEQKAQKAEAAALEAAAAAAAVPEAQEAEGEKQDA